MKIGTGAPSALAGIAEQLVELRVGAYRAHGVDMLDHFVEEEFSG